MDWFFTLLGLAVIGLAINDVFHTLLHPSGQGRISRLCIDVIWKCARTFGPKTLSVAGPLAVVSVILLWTALQILGWALIHFPHVPQGFSYSSGIAEDRYGDFAEAVHFSAVALSTVGFGDMVATDPLIRFASPLESLIGFGLLTAAVTWFMQIYPALGRRRSLAVRLTLLRRAGYADRVEEARPAVVAPVLEALTEYIIQVRVDLLQTPESYYFREASTTTSLGASISYALRLSEAAVISTDASVRLSGSVLRDSLADLAGTLNVDFGLSNPTATPAQIFSAYAADHKYDYA